MEAKLNLIMWRLPRKQWIKNVMIVSRFWLIVNGRLHWVIFNDLYWSDKVINENNNYFIMGKK